MINFERATEGNYLFISIVIFNGSMSATDDAGRHRKKKEQASESEVEDNENENRTEDSKMRTTTTIKDKEQDKEDKDNVEQKPARRRRLAHRRQYAKSRRANSSYLRSQFVHYDNLRDRYEPEDSWFWVQTPAGLHGDGEGRGRQLQQAEAEAEESCFSNWIKFEKPNQKGRGEEINYFVNYSSSSLDSCSLIEPNSSNSSATAARSSRQHAGSALAAKSLSYLPNLSKSELVSSSAACCADRSTNIDVQTRTNQRAVREESDARRSGEKADRVVRSETVDLNRVRWSECERANLYQPPHVAAAAAAKHQFEPVQARRVREILKTTAGSIKSPATVSGRFVSLNNLVYSSSDSSTTQSSLRQAAGNNSPEVS